MHDIRTSAVQMCMTADSVSCAWWLICVMIQFTNWVYMIFDAGSCAWYLKAVSCASCVNDRCLKTVRCASRSRFLNLSVVHNVLRLSAAQKGCVQCLNDYQMCIVQAVQDVGHLAAVHDVWRLSAVNCASCAWCLNPVNCTRCAQCLKIIRCALCKQFKMSDIWQLCMMSEGCQMWTVQAVHDV